jgi:alpha-ribazole phosphatase
MQVYLVRHIKPNTPSGLCYGQYNVPLPPNHSTLHQSLIKKLPAQVDAVYSSDLDRCKLLAKDYCEETNQLDLLKINNQISELNFGDWENKLWDEINQEEVMHWMNNYETIAPPNGETYKQLFERVTLFYNQLLKQSFKTVVIFTHAGVIRSFYKILLELTIANAFKLPCHVSSISLINISSNSCYNSISYLNTPS